MDCHSGCGAADVGKVKKSGGVVAGYHGQAIFG